MGLCATFSFYPSKNLGAFGDAGMLVTQDAEFAAKARLLRNHGAEARYFHKKVGGNFRLDPLQAALLAVKLERLDNYSRRRGENAQYYASRLHGIDGLVLPEAHPYSRHIWNQYTLQVPSRRDAFREFLASRDIGSEIYYPLPLHAQECFAALASPSLPVAERLSADCVSIPIYPELTQEQLDTVAAATREFCGVNPLVRDRPPRPGRLRRSSQ
jgi:dTDP-4-amino-4,6-dideoxygalactose transaminase